MTEGAAPEEPSTAAESTDSVRELIERAREAAEVRPELAGILEQIERLDEVELEHHPELFERVHHVLRSVLANAGDAPEPLPDSPSDSPPDASA